MRDIEDQVLPYVLMRLNTSDTPTMEQVREAAEIGAKMTPLICNGATLDPQRLVIRIMEIVSVNVGDATVMTEGGQHKEWLDSKRATIDWVFWDRYRRYESQKGLPLKVVNKLDDTTDTVLSKLEDPTREGRWSTRGLVVGRVQSGKTANYIGLISKAIDAGYKVVIVLAGTNNDLRSQTQLRLDEGIYGHSTVNSLATEGSETRPKIGVGRMHDLNFKASLPVPLTTSDANGDFKRVYAQQASGIIGQVPIYLVMKKNKSLLENVIAWAKQIHAELNSSQQHVIRNIPFLLIDDEADNASVNTQYKNTKDEDYKVSEINKKIRELLKLFEKSAYVGYTATPFANIYIPPDASTEELGDDIFPRDFIVNMDPPSNYIGPERVFGLSAEGDDEITPLPIVREISDYEQAFPQKHKKEHVPDHLPETLKEAIKFYILGSAVRLARGQASAHSSMLIHVTRYIDVQGEVVGLVGDYLRDIVYRLRYGDGAGDSVVSEFHELWNREYLHTLNAFEEDADNYDLIKDNGNVEWNDVEDLLYRAADKIKVKEMNGKAKDSLDYDTHKEVGLSVIAIGADKLARGLTLEGLTVSYFLRPSKLYDTLLQMGRWFGYRDGYLDVCRIYSTGELIGWYKHITQASVELFREFDEMAKSGATPKTFGLKVLSSENGLRVTAPNKMRFAKEVYLSYSGRLVELSAYYRDKQIRINNLRATEVFLDTIGPHKESVGSSGSVKYTGVAPEQVTRYLKGLRTPEDIFYNTTANGGRIEEYVRGQVAKGELQNWTVVLLSSKDEKYGRHELAGHTTRLFYRSEQEGFAPESEYFLLNRSKLISPRDEYVYDFDESMREKALALTQQAYRDGTIKAKKLPSVPNTRIIRKVRDKRNGLLLIYPLHASDGGPVYLGYAVSFPETITAQGKKYAVNQTHMEL